MRKFIDIMESHFEEPVVVAPPEPGISVVINDAYRASWVVEPILEEYEMLFRHIMETPEQPAYYIGGIVLLNKRKALIAVNSLGITARPL